MLTTVGTSWTRRAQAAFTWRSKEEQVGGFKPVQLSHVFVPLARRFEAGQAPVTRHRRLAQPLLLRVDGGGEDVGLAGCLVAAPPVLLGCEAGQGVSDEGTKSSALRGGAAMRGASSSLVAHLLACLAAVCHHAALLALP